MNEKMLACLSIRQPWASLIAANIKPLENREWPCRYQGDLAIHAGMSWDRGQEVAYQSLLQIAIDMGDDRRIEILHRSRDLRGGIVGTCTMVGCVNADVYYACGGKIYDGITSWFVGPYAFAVKDAQMFRRLVPYKGQQGLFYIPWSVVAPFMENAHA